MTDLRALAEEAALAAAALLRQRFTAPARGVATKETPTDLVSDADRDAEVLLIERIRAARPDDAIVGEEGSRIAGRSGLRWLVDPLDGTTNFLYGIPYWAVSVACEDDGGTLAGVVVDPVRGDVFAASRGGGATMNGDPIRVSGTRDLSQALVATGFSYSAEVRATQARALLRVLPAVRDIRRPGAAALDLAWTAAGRYDAFYEAPINRWDVAAGMLLVEEAGGIARPLRAAGGEGVIAATAALYEPLLALVVA